MKTLYDDCDDNFVLFDLEALGTMRGYDQLLEVAAVRTDSDLEVADRLELRCQRLSHVTPTADAALNCADPTTRQRASLSHLDLVRQTFLTMKAWSPAVYCAHNGLAFDECILRSALYQTLHPPYLTQTRGNRRIDSMLMARACAILAPDALVVPNIDGKETFNLGSLARSNQIPFPTEKAHDAVEDVEAMRQLLARIKDQAPTLFDHLVRISGKETVLNLVQTHDYFRLSDYHFGKPVSRIMAAITRAPSNPNALAAFDLAHDPTEVLQMTEDQLQEALTASPRKIRVIALNAYPIISAVGAFSGEPRVAIASKILAERACLIHRDQDFQQRVARVMERRSAQTSRPAEPEYQNLAGFASDDDEALCARFHSIPWENRRAILDRIQDERLKGFALRLFYAERPDLLGERERQEIVAWQCDRILSDAAAPWMSAPKALERLAVMMKSTDPEVRRKLEIYVEQVARIRSVATQLPHGKRQKNAA